LTPRRRVAPPAAGAAPLPAPLAAVQDAPRPLPLVAPAMDPGVEVPNVRFEIPSKILPRHLAHPGAALGLKRPVGRPQAVEVDVVQERREPRILVPSQRSVHAIKPAWHPSPALGQGRVGPVAGECSLSTIARASRGPIERRRSPHIVELSDAIDPPRLRSQRRGSGTLGYGRRIRETRRRNDPRESGHGSPGAVARR
jgi:hypothetical protein